MKPAEKVLNITSGVTFSSKLCSKLATLHYGDRVTDPEPVSVTTKLKASRKTLDSTFNHEVKTNKLKAERLFTGHRFRTETQCQANASV